MAHSYNKLLVNAMGLLQQLAGAQEGGEVTVPNLYAKYKHTEFHFWTFCLLACFNVLLQLPFDVGVC